MIVGHNITKIVKNGLNQLVILENVSLAINDSEFVSICGPSGCGKSTLLAALSGIDRPNKGDVLIDGKNIYELSKSRLAEFRNENIGIIFQNYNLINTLSVEENIEIPQYLAKKGKRSTTKAKELIEFLGLKDKVKTKISNLSGGEQQRVAIARALIQKPKIIFADEPTGSLDYENGRIIIELFKKIRDEINVSIVLVTHDNQIAEISDRIVYMERGKLLI